jgi:hypothetical protein
MSPFSLVVVVLAVISPILGKITISIEPTGQVNWKTAVTITCGSDAESIPSGDFDVTNGADSLFQDTVTYSINSNDRVTGTEIDGGYTVVISDLMATDDGQSFKCGANRKGYSEEAATLSVLEPPAVPANLAVVPSYNDAAVSFDAADGATYYTVAYLASGESAFTSASEDLATNTFSLNSLQVATSYTVKVAAFNAAGSRDSTTVIFKTLDNRTPLAPEGVSIIKTWTENYTKVSISISWDSSNTGAASIPITKSKIVMSKNGETDTSEIDGDVKEHVFESMDPDTTYEFSVILVNENGDGPAANGALTVPKPTTRPPTTKAPTQPPTTQPKVSLTCDQGYDTNLIAEAYGDKVTLSCSAVNTEGSAIAWKYEGAAYPGENNAGAPTVEGGQSTIVITANEISQGQYECYIVDTDYSCSYTIQAPEVGAAVESDAISATVSLGFLTALILFYLH